MKGDAMEFLFPLMFVAVVFGLFAYLKRQGITGAPYQSIDSTVPVKSVSKAQTEQEIKDDWISQFKGEMSEGNHKIVKTWYAKMVMKDGSDWPANRTDHWPAWECSCGVSGKWVVWGSDFEAAEKKALEKATQHVNDMNYVEWKNNNRLDGRAF